MKTSQPWILAIDQGTSGTTCMAFSADGAPLAKAYVEIPVQYLPDGFVEQDPLILIQSVKATAKTVITEMGSPPSTIGITNQRETVIPFDIATLQPLGPAVVWQCKRGAPFCEVLREQGHEGEVRAKTGLVLDPYFSASKMHWLLEHVDTISTAADTHTLGFATVDAWIIANITGGKAFITDASNASRTLLYNSETQEYDPSLCALFGVPMATLPTVGDSSGPLAITDKDAFFGYTIPITGIAGDQQAALFGHGCTAPGMSKNTYGTGAFCVMKVDERPQDPIDGVLTTVAWRIDGKDAFAVEGSVFSAGAIITWLRDTLHLIKNYDEIEPMIVKAGGDHGLLLIPAFSGLGSPWWEPNVRGALLGLELGSTRGEILRAAIESMAYRTRDVVLAMELGTGVRLTELRVDGGVAVSPTLCQFQADILQIPVIAGAITDATGRGAALLAACGIGLRNMETPVVPHGTVITYTPQKDAEWANHRYGIWHKQLNAVRAAMTH